MGKGMFLNTVVSLLSTSKTVKLWHPTSVFGSKNVYNRNLIFGAPRPFWNDSRNWKCCSYEEKRIKRNFFVVFSVTSSLNRFMSAGPVIGGTVTAINWEVDAVSSANTLSKAVRSLFSMSTFSDVYWRSETVIWFIWKNSSWFFCDIMASAVLTFQSYSNQKIQVFQISLNLHSQKPSTNCFLFSLSDSDTVFKIFCHFSMKFRIPWGFSYGSFAMWMLWHSTNLD